MESTCQISGAYWLGAGEDLGTELEKSDGQGLCRDSFHAGHGEVLE